MKYKPGDLVYYDEGDKDKPPVGIVCRVEHNWIQVKWFKSPYHRPFAGLSFYRKIYWGLILKLEDHADYPA